MGISVITVRGEHYVEEQTTEVRNSTAI